MLLIASLQNIRTLDELILWGGYLLLFTIIFAETGLFAGFFLPGDSLLITAGLIAASGRLDITTALATMAAAAVLGDSTGYLIGKQLQKSIFSKKETLFFHRDHLDKTEAFYRKHGAKTIFLARFVPVVRSFAATLAGVAAMPYPVFLFYSLTGAVLWVLCFTLTGYYIASMFPEVVQYLHIFIMVGIVLIVLSALRHLKPGKHS
ncbi:MAG: DedA family protein [Chlorobium limicola]|jgi:membrane-associated protein|uniref:SNARE associated Golgi protein n=1 Tax=Chlorobium limicola (strain DSM 245 / NBRC 103803 / 6330) TaxID=290315 RepID=B3EGI1_CHLL2|nr:VTT domain-containing protein [Chlorobium limicola]ACD89618.1 SNARE associated Golgi protein [Chlorobium limicola DSM 245]NTV08883.1 DedA family protein [Chlorobium limicola]NTV20800.1 DedA family protein [Chlorobium limicola]